MIHVGSGDEHDEDGGAEQDDARDARHERGQGQRVHEGVSQGEDGQCLPGLTTLFGSCAVQVVLHSVSLQRMSPRICLTNTTTGD